MQAFAVARDHDGARQFLYEMEMGQWWAGITCYANFILSCVRAKAWPDAMAAHDTMKRNGIVPNGTATQGLLLSAFHLGGPDQVQVMLQDLLSDNAGDSGTGGGGGARINQESCVVALSLLFPQWDIPLPSSLGIAPDSSSLPSSSLSVLAMPDIRNRIRDQCAHDPKLVVPARDVCRCLRMAEVEEERPAVTTAAAKDDDDSSHRTRAQKAWKTALRTILALKQAMLE